MTAKEKIAALGESLDAMIKVGRVPFDRTQPYTPAENQLLLRLAMLGTAMAKCLHDHNHSHNHHESNN